MKNKTSTRRIVLILFCAFLTFNLLYSCKNTKDLIELDSTALRDTSQGRQLLKTSGGCYCDPLNANPYCGECVTDIDSGIMRGSLSKSYEVTWTNCKTNDGGWTNCGKTQNAKTKLTFCYGDPTFYPPTNPPSTDCVLYMQIDNPPECLRCVTGSPFCEKLKIVCDATNKKKTSVILSFNDGEISGSVEYTITVQGDPVIVFKCKTTGTDGFVHEYECTGEF